MKTDCWARYAPFDRNRFEVLSQRHAKILRERDRHDMVQTWRRIGLAIIAVAPAQQSSVAPQNDAVMPSRRDSNHIAQPGGRGGLAEIVPSPARNRAITPKCQRMS